MLRKVLLGFAGFGPRGIDEKDDRKGLNETFRTLATQVRRALVTLFWGLRGLLRAIWSVARTPVLFGLNVLAALLILFEEWGWRPLSEALARLAKYRPWAAAERAIAKLPPYAALLVFALPTTLLLPLKFVAMWLLAQGQVATATALFIGAKIVSTALIARIFLLTKPALMRIAWFARAYEWFMPWKDHLFAIIRASWVWRYGRMVKTRTKLMAARTVARWRPVLEPRIAVALERIRAWGLRVKARLSGRDTA
ncbi:MAG: hypothetical protein ACKVP4_14000 [Hyphomicrobium sp.]